uniref:Nuclear receptor interacting protein 2 n=1 Tax=Chelonoidis abingdonii TaxID=106734 RepID=A0A8C0H4W2_CHEAB
RRTPEEGRRDLPGNLDRRQHEVELRDKAILQQKRRLKQATQFVHKDSADLLPLDGLKRLGTSKDLQPHSVVQRRLLEGNLNKLRGESREYTTWVQSPLCQGQVLRAAVNTGCQQNLISMSCLKRLGLEEVSDAGNGDLSLPVPSVIGQVECVEVQLGQETVVCSALVVGEPSRASSPFPDLFFLPCRAHLNESSMSRGGGEGHMAHGAGPKHSPVYNAEALILLCPPPQGDAGKWGHWLKGSGDDALPGRSPIVGHFALSPKNAQID